MVVMEFQSVFYPFPSKISPIILHFCLNWVTVILQGQNNIFPIFKVYLFNKCILSTYYVPGIVLDTGDIMESKVTKSLTYGQ